MVSSNKAGRTDEIVFIENAFGRYRLCMGVFVHGCFELRAARFGRLARPQILLVRFRLERRRRYRCGFDKKARRGWGGPKGWAGAAGRQPSSGAWFELPPPAPPVSAPSIATERYVEPLRGGAAAGSPTGGPLRR